MKISLIVAKAMGDVIGVNNQLPWHLSDDLKRFKALTWGKPILMGRKTYESIGRPLPGRTNIVLTHDIAYLAPGCLVVSSLEQAFQVADQFEELMVIGGAKVYELCLPYASKLYITQIEKIFQGDAKFPKIDLSEWQETEKQTMPISESNDFVYHYLQYVKK
jgi:dihydrofolate reductase